MWIMVDCWIETEIKDGLCNKLKHTAHGEKSDGILGFHGAPQDQVEKGIAFAIELMETKY